MKALRSASVLLFAFFLLLPGTALAQEETETLTISLNRDFGYGGFDGRIQGRFTLHASGAEELVRVEFFINDDLLGIVETAPFEVQFHTDNFEPGSVTLYAVGYTADGSILESNRITRRFISAEEARSTTTGLVFPILLVVGVMSAIGVIGPLLIGRRQKVRPIGEYGNAGGAVCPKCSLPFSRNFLSPNMLVGKLERCPHCGRWSIVRRAGPADLAAAEERLRQDSQEGALQAEESEEERLRRMVEESRFED